MGRFPVRWFVLLKCTNMHSASRRAMVVIPNTMIMDEKA